ncbi:MAG: hypothetical protein AAFW89_12390 [Bacteroidota bacterium]
MQQLYRNDYIIHQFEFLERDYGFRKKEVHRLNLESDTECDKFTWVRAKITVEIIHESDALPWSIVYKKTRKGLIKFTESNQRMGLSKLKDREEYCKWLMWLFKRLTEEDFQQRVQFMRDELSNCIEDIISYKPPPAH